MRAPIRGPAELDRSDGRAGRPAPAALTTCTSTRVPTGAFTSVISVTRGTSSGCVDLRSIHFDPRRATSASARPSRTTWSPSWTPAATARATTGRRRSGRRSFVRRVAARALLSFRDDIRGVFDGTIISNGVLGHPTIMCTSTPNGTAHILDTSTYTGSLGAESSPPEQEGAETQSLAYTTDGGETWIKCGAPSQHTLTAQVPHGRWQLHEPSDLPVAVRSLARSRLLIRQHAEFDRLPRPVRRSLRSALTRQLRVRVAVPHEDARQLDEGSVRRLVADNLRRPARRREP